MDETPSLRRNTRRYVVKNRAEDKTLLIGISLTKTVV